MKVDSPQNPLVKQALVHAKQGNGALLLEGPNLIEAALAAPPGRVAIEAVFVIEQFAGRNKTLMSALSARCGKIIEASERAMKRLSDTSTPQGIVALARVTMVNVRELLFKGITVVLDGVQDPGNVGAVIRTAAAFGAGAVVAMPGTADPFGPKALRASAGAALGMDIVMATRAAQVHALMDRGVSLYVASAHGGADPASLALPKDVAVAFGAEGEGISPELKAAAAGELTLSIGTGAESLNVAASSAILLYIMSRNPDAG